MELYKVTTQVHADGSGTCNLGLHAGTLDQVITYLNP